MSPSADTVDAYFRRAGCVIARTNLMNRRSSRVQPPKPWPEIPPLGFRGRRPMPGFVARVSPQRLVRLIPLPRAVLSDPTNPQGRPAASPLHRIRRSVNMPPRML